MRGLACFARLAPDTSFTGQPALSRCNTAHRREAAQVPVEGRRAPAFLGILPLNDGLLPHCPQARGSIGAGGGPQTSQYSAIPYFRVVC